jgi:hypothetical protein
MAGKSLVSVRVWAGDALLLVQTPRIPTDGRVKRAFGIQETNIALSRPIERRPAAKIVGELNALLASQRV